MARSERSGAGTDEANDATVPHSEPVTAATDYLLALVTGYLALLLMRQGGDAEGIAWSAALALTAAAAVVGGSFHGFRGRLGEEAAGRLWGLTLLLSAAAGFTLLLAAALGVESRGLRIGLLVLALGKLILSVVLLGRTHRFAVVLYDAGASLLLILLLSLGRAAVGEEGALWLAAGAATALGGGAAQLRERRILRYFNHNDLFHLAQAVAAYLLYRGARGG